MRLLGRLALFLLVTGCATFTHDPPVSVAGGTTSKVGFTGSQGTVFDAGADARLDSSSSGAVSMESLDFAPLRILVGDELTVAVPGVYALESAPTPGSAHPLMISVGAAAGGAIGTLIGAQFQSDCEQRCINARGALGPLVGNTVLIPLGAHLVNKGRGSMVTSMLVSSGWAAAAMVASGLSDETWPVWAIAPGQLLSSVVIEWVTGRRSSREGSSAR